MREIVHLQAGQCGNQIGAKVSSNFGLNMKSELTDNFRLGGLLNELT